MHGPSTNTTEVKSEASRGSEPGPQGSLPAKDAHPYAKERAEIKALLSKSWGEGGEALAEAVLNQLDTSLKSDNRGRQKLATDVYAGFQKGDVGPLKLAVDAAKTQIRALTEKKSLEVAQLQSTLEALQQEQEQLASLAQESVKPEVEQQLQGERPTAESPQEEVEEEPTQTPKVEPIEKQPEVLIASTRLSFQQSRANSNFLDTHNRDLRLMDNGEVQMRFLDSKGESVWLSQRDQTTDIEVKALFADGGKLYTADGTEVDSLQWGKNPVSASHVLGYSDSLQAGKLSGVRDGYLKDVSYTDDQGKRYQVVFTLGKPPKKEKETVVEQEAATTPETSPGQDATAEEDVQSQAETETETKTETEQQEHEEVHQAEESDPLTPNPAQESEPESSEGPSSDREYNPEPIEAQRPQQSEAQDTEQEPEPVLPTAPKPEVQPNPSSRITFQHADAYGRLNSTPRDFRLAEDGSLRMRFLDSGGESVWLEPTEGSTQAGTRRSYTCLYHHQGKFYDAKGNEVKKVNWAGNQWNASALSRYTDTLEKGKVSGIRSGYVNNITYNGKQVVFTEGLPEGVVPKPAPEPEIRQQAYREVRNYGSYTCPNRNGYYQQPSNYQYQRQSYQQRGVFRRSRRW